MNNEKAIKILRKGYPNINRYAASELDAYEYDVEEYNEAVSYAISLLDADRWRLFENELPSEYQTILITNDRHEVHKIIWYKWWHEDTKYPHRTYGKEVAWKPLPKGHGRLIAEPTEADISNTVGGNNDFAECIRDSVKAVFDNATTIIEADKESGNGL